MHAFGPFLAHRHSKVPIIGPDTLGDLAQQTGIGRCAYTHCTLTGR
jgi:hypothetical protein